MSEAVDLKGRSMLTLRDFTAAEIQHLVDLAIELKAAKRDRREEPALVRRNIALIFEKSSTRTRCAFEVAAHDQGAHVSYIDPASTQMGDKESIRDTARVLGRMFDGIEFRGYSQHTVEVLAQYAGVPVYNGLTDRWHPTQMLADAMTMQEYSRKPLSQVSYAYLGDARYNMGNSLLVLGATMSMDVRIAAPPGLQPEPETRRIAAEIAEQSGARITITEDPRVAVAGVDFVHTDVWVSMGEPMQAWAQRIPELLPYQVNAGLMAASGNADVRFMHCLPAFHDSETTVGAQIAEEFPELAKGAEVTDDVFESAASVVFDQAENRMHTIKALLVATLS